MTGSLSIDSELEHRSNFRAHYAKYMQVEKTNSFYFYEVIISSVTCFVFVSYHLSVALIFWVCKFNGYNVVCYSFRPEKNATLASQEFKQF